MTPERWKQIEKLYHAALEREPGGRNEFLDEACAGDEVLRQEVESLLTQQKSAERFIEAPALEVAANGLATNSAQPTVVTPSKSPSHSMIGQIVSHYRILEKLGEGGMGVIYKAQDLKLERLVALKFLPHHVCPDEEEKIRFIREAKAASALDHPNIGTIYEIVESDDGQMSIVMAYYEGETLKQKIEHGPLPVKEAQDFASQIALGLAKAHSREIVHRDIKPGNLLVTPDGVVKIIDFGLAKLGGLTKITKTHTTMGTMAYISPEQARGEEVDQRSDVWSLGVVLYEMLTGQLPFPGAHAEAIIHSILTAKPKPLRELRPEVPAEIRRIVHRTLEKDLKSRYGSAVEVLKDLTEYQSSVTLPQMKASAWRVLSGWLRQKQVAIPSLLILLLLSSLLGWLFHRQANISWARRELLPKIDQLIEAGWEHYADAYRLAVEAEKYLPHDPKLSEFLSKTAVVISIKTEPPGANLYMKEYMAPQSEWRYLGVSPIDKIRLPIGIFRWKMEKEGYETVLAASSTFDGVFTSSLVPYDIVRVLDKKGGIPVGMVRVKGETEIGDFLIDQYEVSNKQFKEFADGGGYRKREYWKQKFIKDGKELTWEEATKEFVDQTGQSGPANWRVGDYPEGQADYPVSGVSWYEAAAYAEFVGKSLPTASHWGIARGDYTPLLQNPFYAFVAPLSNFKGKGAAPVGSYPGMTSFGAFDMAGNEREWCWNESPNGRIVRGGAWDDPNYMFDALSQAPAFDRSPRNGFRCALYLDPDKVPKSTFQLEKLPESPDFYRQKPVSNSIFEVYKEQFSYDKTDLNARVEWRNESSKDWIQEKVTFNAAYENERMIAYLFLPRRGSPPYQTIVYFPGSPAREQRSSNALDKDFHFDYHLSFIVKNGRAVLFPLYKGTFERGNDALTHILEEASSRQYVEVRIKEIKDFKRSIDYLESRPDIDSQRLAYAGFSWGAATGAIIPAVEDRLKASVLYVGGMAAPTRPEVDQINYVTRVKIPTLMLNGRYDMLYPYETSSKPMFDFLGTPKEHKEQKLYDSDHFIPRNELIKETLNWLDRYLGPVKRNE